MPVKVLGLLYFPLIHSLNYRIVLVFGDQTIKHLLMLWKLIREKHSKRSSSFESGIRLSHFSRIIVQRFWLTASLCIAVFLMSCIIILHSQLKCITITWNFSLLRKPMIKSKKFGENGLSFHGSLLFNKLPFSIRTSASMQILNKLKKCLLINDG